MKWFRPTITGKFTVLLFGFLMLQFLQLGLGIYAMTRIEWHGTLVNTVNEQRLRLLQLAELARNVSISYDTVTARGDLAFAMARYGEESRLMRKLLAEDRARDQVLRDIADEADTAWTTLLHPLLQQVRAARAPAAMRVATEQYQASSVFQVERLNTMAVLLGQRDRQAARHLAWLQTAIVALSLAFVLAAIFLMRRLVTQPLRHFFEATRAMANGAYDRRVEVRTNDEIGELARSFNRMAAAVDDKTARLHALNEVALIVTSSLSLTEILDQIMLYGMPLAGARGVCIAFYDESTRSFSSRVTRGLSERYTESKAYQSSRLAAEAMRLGEPVLSSDLPDAAYPLSAEARQDGIRSVVCLPLASAQERLGVILFYRNDRSDFSFEDVELVRTFSHLAAHAIQNARLHARTVNLAETDPLTGLYNRRKFEQRLREEIQRSQRSRQPLALLLLDIDHFKKVNDTYGHSAGDAVLKALALTFRKETRDVDMAARMGGEEFVFLLPDTDPALAQRVAERIRAAVMAQAIAISEAEKIRITASIGIACYPLHANSAEALIVGADRAVYAAKQAGRNRVWMTGESMLR